MIGTGDKYFILRDRCSRTMCASCSFGIIQDESKRGAGEHTDVWRNDPYDQHFIIWLLSTDGTYEDVIDSTPLTTLAAIAAIWVDDSCMEYFWSFRASQLGVLPGITLGETLDEEVPLTTLSTTAFAFLTFIFSITISFNHPNLSSRHPFHSSARSNYRFRRLHSFVYKREDSTPFFSWLWNCVG